MKYISEFESCKIVESTKKNQWEIMTALDSIFSHYKTQPIIHIVLDDINHRALICLFREPLENEWHEEIVTLARHNRSEWKPKIDIWLVERKLISGRDSRDSQ